MKLQGLVFDWAGTLADHGSRAPVATLEAIFAATRVPVTVAEARLAMGIAKKEHIRAILALPRVRGEWAQVYGTEPGEPELEALYAAFIPKQLDCLVQHSDVIAGVPEAFERFRGRGLQLGSSTGYTRPMLDCLLQLAARQNLKPDAAFCPDEVPFGRPAPWMCFRNAMQLGIYPMWTMVKIGDTPSDIAEGLNAGMWTIGVTRTGNETGLTAAEWNATLPAAQQALEGAAGQRLLAAGAHYLAPSVAECDPFLDAIEDRLRAGHRP